MSFELSYEMFKQAAGYAGVKADGTIFYWPHLELTDMPEDFDPENEAEEDCD